MRWDLKYSGLKNRNRSQLRFDMEAVLVPGLGWAT